MLLELDRRNLYSTRLIFPFFKGLIPDLGWWYAVFAVIVLVGASNAVNLTDGLDGLAISTFAIAAATFTALAYVTGHRVFAEYLLLLRLPQAAELTIFCGSLVGASLAFLWYNAHPAEVFMGDVGSLALGSALGTVAILLKQELLLVIVGGVFVMEALSVIAQVGDVQADGAPAVSHGAAAPPLRAGRLAGNQGDDALRHHGDRLRAVQPHVAEAQVRTMAEFDIAGKRVVVVGAARSGIAAAELLAVARRPRHAGRPRSSSCPTRRGSPRLASSAPSGRTTRACSPPPT